MKTNKEKYAATCLWCEQILIDSPTDKWWIGHRTHGKGICYDCVLSLAKQVLGMMEYNSRVSINESTNRIQASSPCA